MAVDCKILLEAAERFGTPVYVYDIDLIIKRYNDLHDYIKYPKLKIHYAMKANFNFQILKILNEIGSSIDAVSPGDVMLAIKAGFTPDRILYTANSMTDAEVEEVAQAGVLLNIDSLSRLEKFGKTYPGSKVCLRFNPDVLDGAHPNIMTGGDLTKFGILMADVYKAKDICEEYDLTVIGLHEHTGSGLQHTKSVYQSMKNIMALATPENFPHLDFLDFGGGFNVTYKPNEKNVDYVEMGTEISRLFREFTAKYGKDLAMYFEPGKFIVAEAGYMLTEVNTIRNNNGRIIIGCNSGFPQLIRPVMYDAYHHIMNLSNLEGKSEIVDICGNICETGDRFAEQREMNEVREGDILSIENAGAYCYSMGGVYNLRPMPPEIIYYKSNLTLARRALTSQELIEKVVEL